MAGLRPIRGLTMGDEEHSELGPDDSASNVNGGSRLRKASVISPGLLGSSASSVATERSTLALGGGRPERSLGIAGSSGGQGATFNCKFCKRNLPLTTMSPSRKGVCVTDGNSYKSLTDRWAKCRALRLWWNSLDENGKADWFLKQQKLSSGERRKFDCVQYEEGSSQVVASDETERDHYETNLDFALARTTLGWPIEKIEEDWLSRVERPNSDAILRRGQWLVPKFCGVLIDKRKSQLQETSSKRSKTIADPEQLQQLQSNGQRMLGDFWNSIAGAKAPEVVEAPVVDATEADQPSRAIPQDVVGNNIDREVMATLRDNTTRAQAEAEDLMAAIIVSGDTDARVSAKDESQLTLIAVKAVGAASVALERCAAEVKTMENDAAQCMAKFPVRAAGEDEDESITALRGDIDDAQKQAIRQVREIMGKIKIIQQEMKECTTCDGVQEKKKALADVMKEMQRHAVKAFKGKVRSAVTWLETNSRRAAVASGAVTNALPARVEELVAISTKLVTPFNTGSVFEAMSGLKICMLPAKKNTDLVSAVSAFPFVKKMYKDCDKHLQEKAWGVFPIVEVDNMKNLTRRSSLRLIRSCCRNLHSLYHRGARECMPMKSFVLALASRTRGCRTSAALKHGRSPADPSTCSVLGTLMCREPH